MKIHSPRKTLRKEDEKITWRGSVAKKKMKIMLLFLYHVSQLQKKRENQELGASPAPKVGVYIYISRHACVTQSTLEPVRVVS